MLLILRVGEGRGGDVLDRATGVEEVLQEDGAASMSRRSLRPCRLTPAAIKHAPRRPTVLNRSSW